MTARPSRTLLAPRTLAKMLQLAEIEPDGTVLDVGCATGYSTALLSKLAGKVVALEADPALAERAARSSARARRPGLRFVQGPLEAGAPTEAPFDAILLDGAVPEVPQALLDQLKDGGRLVAIVVPDGYGRAQVWRRTGLLRQPYRIRCGGRCAAGFRAASRLRILIARYRPIGL